MVEGVVAAMAFLGVLSEKDKAELIKNGSSSEGIQMDQAAMNGRGLPFEEHCNEKMGLTSSNRTVNGVVKRSVAECIPRPLDLSVVAGSGSNYSNNLFPNQSGFGSPIAVMGELNCMRTLSNDHQDRCSWPIASTIHGKQSGLQLTVFYGGTMKVYEDIPADKAEAIMLIAGSGTYSTCQHTEVNKGCGSQITRLKTSLPLMKLSEGSGIQHQRVMKLSEGSGIQHQRASRINQYSDLPIANKHSLQRFLEKRKDRLNENAKSLYKADNTKPRQHRSSSLSPIPLKANSVLP